MVSAAPAAYTLLEDAKCVVVPPADAPPGTVFYCKLTVDGQCRTSRMVSREAGVATWNEPFLFSAHRPIPPSITLEIDMFASVDNK